MRRTSVRNALICLGVAMGIVVAFSGKSLAAELYVPGDYPTVQSAINAAQPGDTVLVDAGVYNEYIFLKSGVTVQGSGADQTKIVLGVTALNVHDSVVSGFTIGGSYGVWNWAASPIIVNNIVTALYEGIGNRGGSSPTITNNIIISKPNYFGIRSLDSTPTITNNVIVRGRAGIVNIGSPSTITNNIIAYNVLGGIVNMNSASQITYNGFWSNGADILNYSSNPTVADNIYEDPLFVDPNNSDYHLQEDSPCIDAGTNEAPGLSEKDLDGNPRIVDGDGDSVTVVDMGVYEFMVPTIPATVDIDPDILNLKSRGRWITVYTELPEGYSVEDIDLDTVALTQADGKAIEPPIHVTGPQEVGDHDGDEVADLMVKFDRSEVQAALEAGEEVKITVSGELYDGISFEGGDAIRVK